MRLMFASLLLAVSCASSPMEGSQVAAAHAAMAALVQQGFAGSVLVACGDAVVFEGDYGLNDPRGREPSYWLASVSKQFTAAAILRLAETGALTLDDPLSRYFPDVPSDKAATTIRQLLTHQSGLAQAYRADGIADRGQAARAIFSGELLSPPGAAFHYANDNYSLLAMIVEIVSRRSFEDYVRTQVFEPAGLRHAGFWPDAGRDFTPPMLSAPDGAVASANWGFRGSTGMRASAPDLYRWTRALDEGRVLTPGSVRQLYGPHAHVSDGDGVGFGWFWSDLPNGRWLWTRGSEDIGPNVILYRRAGTGLVIIAATNAGPAEDQGPGWSRRARDALTPIFTTDTCPTARPWY